MRVLTIVVASLLLLESFYFVECQRKYPKYQTKPGCRIPCDTPSNCGGKFCKVCGGGGIWTPYRCQK
uniref:Putative secreted salivary protein n=1 Tax=Ixodes scapularis TaxID=6945 RepID=Q4PMI1_IXOSC|nr:putative secreted salivary protein [Ixodes scapularis]